MKRQARLPLLRKEMPQWHRLQWEPAPERCLPLLNLSLLRISSWLPATKAWKRLCLEFLGAWLGSVLVTEVPDFWIHICFNLLYFLVLILMSSCKTDHSFFLGLSFSVLQERQQECQGPGSMLSRRHPCAQWLDLAKKSAGHPI